jgi:hypothetical protein
MIIVGSHELLPKLYYLLNARAFVTREKWHNSRVATKRLPLR